MNFKKLSILFLLTSLFSSFSSFACNVELLSLLTGDGLPKLQLLIESGVNIDEPIPGGRNTALIVSVDHDEFRVVKLLLNAKANTNIRGDRGITALMIAAGRLRVELVNDLLNAAVPADINIKDNAGKTALGWLNENYWLNQKDHPVPPVYLLAKKKIIEAIRKKVIDGLINIEDPKDKESLDLDDPGSFDRDFANQRLSLSKAIEKA